jgi:hypothetical protein
MAKKDNDVKCTATQKKLTFQKVVCIGSNPSWVKWLRMQWHRLPATLEVTGSNPAPGKINLIKIEKNTNGIPDSKKVHLSIRNKRTFELYKNIIYNTTSQHASLCDS